MDAHHRGVRLRDWIVLIAIIGVSLGVLIPAMRDSRDVGGRRVQCINNLRQLGIALTQYIVAHGVFPNAGTFGERAEALPGPGHPDYNARESVIYRMLKDPAQFAAPTPEPKPGETQIGPLRTWVMDILPYMDQTALYNQWDRDRVYDSRTVGPQGAYNAVVAATDIASNRCPDDDTLMQGQGNLSYVVNGGFSRWPGHAVWNEKTGHFEGVFPPGLTGSPSGVAPGYGNPMDWGSDIARRTGVMFLGTARGNTPWDVRTRPNDVTDGMSMTVMLSENICAGYAAPGKNTYSGGAETNWASPLPNSMMFFGSDDICGGPKHASPGSGRCIEDGGLAMIGSDQKAVTGPSWAEANRIGSPEALNAGSRHPVEGGFPYPSSGHPGFVVVAMCDGSAKVIRDTIDGLVWARLLTPAGQTLPDPIQRGWVPGKGSFKQAPIRVDYVE